LPFDLSDVHHLTPSAAGLILLCMPLGMGVVGLLGGYLTDRYGARPFTLAGSALVLAGVVLLSLDLSHPASIFDLSWRLLLVGIGIGLFNGPNQTLLMSSSTREALGAASALSNVSARLGSIIGPLLLGVLWSFLPSSMPRMSAGGIVFVALAILSMLCAWLVRPQAQPDRVTGEASPSQQGPLTGQTE
jgi:MFS transporter, DHA2 family, multidrug resistance protein